MTFRLWRCLFMLQELMMLMVKMMIETMVTLTGKASYIVDFKCDCVWWRDEPHREHLCHYFQSNGDLCQTWPAWTGWKEVLVDGDGRIQIQKTPTYVIDCLNSTTSSNVGDESHLKAALRIGVIILLSQEPPRTLLSELSLGWKNTLLWFSTSHSPWFPRAHKITSRLFQFVTTWCQVVMMM